ncbi:MAG: DNA polymerase/3'-5' exonuclease PolX [Bacteroidetes bacterium]|nr:DNA polymerase/3'-5' exonuclease PolX [Bacteroidota bacterium]
MDNQKIADILESTAKLLELHGDNPFKIKSYLNAVNKIERQDEKLEGKSKEELEKMDGIGKSLSQKIFQLLQEQTFPELDELISKTPTGVIEMMKIKGIGPKKVAALWKELEIESPGELLYACNENRLLTLKGFGQKTQEQIKKSIEFNISQKGLFHYALAELTANLFLEFIQRENKEIHLLLTSEVRRKCEIVSNIQFIAALESQLQIEEALTKISSDYFSIELNESKSCIVNSSAGIQIQIQYFPSNELFYRQWKETGTASHISQCLELNNIAESELILCTSETDIYQKFSLPYIEPELREGRSEISRAKIGTIPKALIELKDLRGILHNHSTYSDGKNTLKEMALACKNSGYEYLGICDHSKSAFYAGGLSIERVAEQQEEIKKLNEELAPFVIFSGIESDILTDGSLDYPEDVLKSFDFIVASVHSGLRMDIEKATTRLITAIRNPYTTILGHPTGRLLLSRAAYPIDYEKVIDACAENDVVIELNAHPYRLDLDWRWIEYAINKGVKISINPDAHSTEGYKDMYYGVCVGRKGFLSANETFNAQNREDINKYFLDRKNAIASNK